jgi:hypothetical protein
VKTKPLLQGAGLATLYILPIAKRFLDQSLNEAYHHPHPISSVPLAILAMTLLVWIVGWMAFLAIEHLPERWRNLASIALCEPGGAFSRDAPSRSASPTASPDSECSFSSRASPSTAFAVSRGIRHRSPAAVCLRSTQTPGLSGY